MDLKDWNWGDVPSWISVALTVLVPASAVLLGYVKRNALGSWLTRSLTRTPPPPVRAVWSVSRMGKDELRLHNFMTVEEGAAAPTPPKTVYIQPLDQSLHLSEAAWPSFGWGAASNFYFEAWGDSVSEECEIIWHVPDRNEPTGWREQREDLKLPIHRG